jgi:hypothetical protein
VTIVVPEELTTMVTGQINVREYRRPKGQSKKDNPEQLTTMATGQINGGEYRRPLSFFDYPFGILHRLFVLWPLLSVTLDCPFLIAPSVFGIL